MKQVIERFFNTKTAREPYRRILELEKSGIVERVHAYPLGVGKVVRLTQTGAEVARSCFLHEDFDLPQTWRLNQANRTS